QGKIDESNPWFDAIMKGYVRIVEFSDPVYEDKRVLAVLTPQYGVFVWDDRQQRFEDPLPTGGYYAEIFDGVLWARAPTKDYRWHLKEIDGTIAFSLNKPGRKLVYVGVYDLSTMKAKAVAFYRDKNKKLADAMYAYASIDKE
ncbi:MAG: hypothetical protein GXO57_06810, partial [Thermodesulfobacteria bacterium]|nr:hypothetical protein [Thermodesulfobacteriota bacterium]